MIERYIALAVVLFFVVPLAIYVIRAVLLKRKEDHDV